MDLTNELESVLNKMQKEKSQKLEQQLMALLENADMLIPALLPFGTDPAMVAKIINSKDNIHGSLPAGMKPQPAMLHDQNGSLCFPVFTSKEELQKGDENKKYPLVLGLPYKNCIDIFLKEKKISCIVVNPFSHNVKINYDRESLLNSTKENADRNLLNLQTMTLIQLETKILPKMMYEQGQDFIDALNVQQGELIYSLFVKQFSSENQCPCEKEDIEVMTLDIRDDLELIRISMPTMEHIPGCAKELFIKWNPQIKSGEYYGIVALQEEEAAQVILICEDGSQVKKGSAPEDGSELEYMIEI